MGKNAKLSESAYISLVNNINKELENAYKAIKTLRDNYKALLAGDKEGPFWNGATASTFYKTAKSNLDNAINAYGEGAAAWAKLREYYITLLRKGIFKK